MSAGSTTVAPCALQLVNGIVHQLINSVMEAGKLAHHAQARSGQALGIEKGGVVGRDSIACLCTGWPWWPHRRVNAVSAPSKIAASVTVRAMGPAVSWLWAMGIIPARLTSPTVGLMPTMPLLFAGHTMEPSVSVPIARAQRFAATAAPEPELEPLGLRSSA